MAHPRAKYVAQTVDLASHCRKMHHTVDARSRATSARLQSPSVDLSALQLTASPSPSQPSTLAVGSEHQAALVRYADDATDLYDFAAYRLDAESLYGPAWQVTLSNNSMEVDVPGQLFLSDFRLLFVAATAASRELDFVATVSQPQHQLVQSIPLTSISTVRRATYTRGEAIVVSTTDLRQSCFQWVASPGTEALAVSETVRRAADLIRGVAFRAPEAAGVRIIQEPFAFRHQRRQRSLPSNPPCYGFSWEREFARLRACVVHVAPDSSAATSWALRRINTDFSLCPTYPSELIVPASLPDEALRAAAAFRSKQRCTWTVFCVPGRTHPAQFLLSPGFHQHRFYCVAHSPCPAF